MAFGKPDPHLEQLRKQVDHAPNLDTTILKIQKLSSSLHSAFLFENEGIFLLQKICLFMSSTPSGKLYKGWEEFAVHLGLSREQIQCIEYNFKGMQDPTYYVLLTFCQSPDATVDKVIIACQKIHRLDIINRILNPLVQFINNLIIDDHNTGVIRPKIIPRVPLVLRPTIGINHSIRSSNDSKHNKLHTDNKSKTELSEKKNYGSIVMLTFTKDGEEVAKNVAKVFRENDPKIGVVILQEQEKYVYSRAEEFVDDCFNQVNYIVPILTSGYINHLNELVAYDESSENSLDTKYVKYIYSLLRYEYFKNNCCNNRVRCIVPNGKMPIILKSNLHPSLQAWFKESEIDTFMKNIILKNF
ncbi:uncharacterized protein [Chelonus insularis]|uniref:uncharacterized protein n=1 Tax=Chelonus insularis TaxID=460826 RepID=UPI00158BA3B1|nr:uncharacterized protein LOC118065480 [Chelonus insularis]